MSQAPGPKSSTPVGHSVPSAASPSSPSLWVLAWRDSLLLWARDNQEMAQRQSRRLRESRVQASSVYRQPLHGNPRDARDAMLLPRIVRLCGSGSDVFRPAGKEKDDPTGRWFRPTISMFQVGRKIRKTVAIVMALGQLRYFGRLYPCKSWLMAQAVRVSGQWTNHWAVGSGQKAQTFGAQTASLSDCHPRHLLDAAPEREGM